MASGDNINPFQSLVFLVRDWSSPNEYRWGFNGGEDFLITRLTSTDDQSDDRKSIRNGIRNSFKDIKCFLMPHPGEKVAENSTDFEGRISAIRKEFRDCLEIFVPFILNPESLLPKEINGNPVTCRQLIEQIKEYAKIFNSDKLPDPKSLFHIIAKTTHEAALRNAYITYLKSMKKKYIGNVFILAFKLNKYHSETQNESLRIFKEFKKMGGANCEKGYLKKLEKNIKKANDEIFNHRKLLMPMAIRSIPIAGATVALGTVGLGISGSVGAIGAVVAGTLFLISNFVKPIEEQHITKKNLK
ncbi:hypothetical protein FO519_009627 [Halicephalobus sp. NKZ332]|nr:hypothetical protein FO519_009627 [Halicephalobus sp. NKZ332]